ncbi:TPA: hypothetical protein ACOQ31_005648 [Bacillus cereus]|nr:hypothetical protein [Bacillus cereus]MBL3768473.1 hypothetical protein [Bacillus cereus]MBL3774456.1 hypothetical protein [Bacillus cereus]
MKEKSGIEKIFSSEIQGEITIKLDFKFPKPFMTYAIWNIKKVAKYDKKHLEFYGPVQIPPGEKGLYVLYDKNDTVLYVGINNEGDWSSLNTRLCDHITDSRFKDYIYRIDTYLIDEQEKRETMEFLLINTLFPIFNKDKTLYKTREEEYVKNPCIYNENKLSTFEKEAKSFNVSPAYFLIQHYWDMKYEDRSASNDVWNWIQRYSEEWIDYIAEENKISQINVFNHAYKYLNLVNYPGEEYHVQSEELGNNIFSDYMDWLRPDDEN